MTPAETVYRGERVFDGQVITGVRVTRDARPIAPPPDLVLFPVTARKGATRFLRQPAPLPTHGPGRFEWGYGGAGPGQLALALLLDATGDVAISHQAKNWFKWAVVAMWRGDTWEIRAGEILRWVAQWAREGSAEADTPHQVVIEKGGVA